MCDSFFQNPFFFDYNILTVLFPVSPGPWWQFILLMPMQDKIHCVSGWKWYILYLFLFSLFLWRICQQNGRSINARSFCYHRCITDSNKTKLSLLSVLSELIEDLVANLHYQLLVRLSFSIALPLQFMRIFLSLLLLPLLSSKVQARMAFSSYLKRVQQRLLAESRANTIPAWPDKDNEQMVQW